MWGYDSPLEEWDKGSNKERVYARYLWMSRWVMGPDVLDIGCSHGSLVRFIDDKNIKGYVGVDVNPKALAYARKHNRRKWAVFTEEVPNALFTTVVLGEVLEHQEKPEELLKLAKSKLAPGGKIIITVPHGIDEVSDHRQVFFTDTLAELLADCNLGPINWEYKDGEIFCVAVADASNWEIDTGGGERNISENLERWICSYRVMERNYEMIRGIRLLKWVKGLRKRWDARARDPMLYPPTLHQPHKEPQSQPYSPRKH